MKTVGIIGAGAAGLALASTLKDQGLEVFLFEQFDKCGKKILASGNGRCNVSNQQMNSSYYNQNHPLIETIIHEFDVEHFFEQRGLVLRRSGVLYYPYSNQATSVKKVLLDHIDATIFYETLVTKIIPSNQQYQLQTTKGNYLVDYVVVTSGSKAGKLSGDKNLDPLLSLGVEVTSMHPSLVQFTTKPVYKQTKGVRAKGNVSMVVDGVVKHTQSGEIQFTDYGLSGICIMQLSRFYHLYDGKKVELYLDLLPEFDKDYINKRIEQFGDLYLEGILNEKLCIVCKQYALDCKQIQYQVTGTRDSQFAQVMQGGVELSQLNEYFELKKHQNVFIAGEVLDVDGDCGGYNLHFAFGSGNYIGRQIIDRVKKCYK